MSPEYSLADRMSQNHRKKPASQLSLDLWTPVISSGEFTSQAADRVSDSKLAGFVVCY